MGTPLLSGDDIPDLLAFFYDCAINLVHFKTNAALKIKLPGILFITGLVATFNVSSYFI